MSGLVQFLEESIIAFIKLRVQTDEWKDIHYRNCVESRMEDDDLNELKEYCFNELMNEVSWNVVLNEIKQLAKEQEVESEEETESEEEEEELGDDESDG